MDRYVVLEKKVGETPLSCAERWRAVHPAPSGVPLTPAGRLDPMASGKLLILIGDECKQQATYHGLDKEYEFSVLFGIGSDTQDILGRLHTTNDQAGSRSLSKDTTLDQTTKRDHKHREWLPALRHLTTSLTKPIALPYPHFSSKTVQGKPLHTWTLEGRLDEINIPINHAEVYELELTKIETVERTTLVDQALTRINSIPPVTDPRKAIGNDFRRTEVRTDWEVVRNDSHLPDIFTIAHFRCVASSGTYMRSLAAHIGQQLDTPALAWHIHRTKIGTYDRLAHTWTHQF